MNKKIRFLLLLLVLSALVIGCGKREHSRDVFAMDTYMTVTAYGSNAKAAVDEAVAEIERLDDLLSTGKEDSEISKLNRTGSGVLSEDGSYLLAKALEVNSNTNGAFDIAIYPLMKLWGFPTGDFKVPSEDEIIATLEFTKCSDIVFDENANSVSFSRDNMAIDLGGIAKGYTSDRIMDIFRANGVKSGIVSLGGNIESLGTKPDGKKWRVAIQNPDDDNSYLGVLAISDKAVITSGGYERFFEEDGIKFHHIIDPSTGYPSNSVLKSVSIVSSDGTLADALSTSIFIMGLDEGTLYWKNHSDEFDMILLTEDDKLYITEGISQDFSTENKNINIIGR